MPLTCYMTKANLGNYNVAGGVRVRMVASARVLRESGWEGATRLLG